MFYSHYACPQKSQNFGLEKVSDNKQIQKPALPSMFEDDLGPVSSEEEVEINDEKSMSAGSIFLYANVNKFITVSLL